MAAGLVVVVLGVMTGQVGAAGDNGFVSPVARAKERVAKKPFGIFITPKNSPIQPERFTGRRTGADYGIFPERKHLHLAVHQGKKIDWRGYVRKQAELKDWLDSAALLP